MNMLYNTVSFGVKEINQPSACVSDDAFDYFIRKRLFPAKKYDLLTDKTDAAANSKSNAKEVKVPYFKFKSRDSGREFYVDSKYLVSKSNSSVEWCRPDELERHQAMNSVTPVYILIGAGPQPAAPQHVFMFPVKNIRFNKVLHSIIEKYKISVTRSVEEKDLAL